MKNTPNYAGIDRFRIVAALLIVGIHTSPLSSVSGELDFLITHIFARIAVPFFLMVTGYFLLPQYLSGGSSDSKPLLGFLKKMGLIYAGATLLYLPISIYAGYYAEGNPATTILKNIVFDGMFYHLWYLPASMLGVILIYLLGRKFSFGKVFGIAAFLYLLGLLGDSYYGIAANIPFLNAVYDAGFVLFSYTRNGIFYAPIFLALGTFLAKASQHLMPKASIVGFFISLILMLAEGELLHCFGLMRHDSMYIALIPCMFFLFAFLLTRKGKAIKALRDISLLVYILHPLCIVAVRGVAKLLGLTGLLVDNSLIHYVAVCTMSVMLSVGIITLKSRKKTSRFSTGRAWIELDMNHLRHNVDVLRGLLPKGCELMPAVKANAYGHGAVAISKELNCIGIRAFCVASVMEGVELRKHSIKGEILILGYTHPKQFNLLRKYRLTQTAIDGEYAKSLNSTGRKIAVHIKVDTGMHRLGERSENVAGILRMFEYKNLVITGIYTHLCADDTDSSFTKMQIERFYEVISKINVQGFCCPKVHIQSSYGVLNCPELLCDYARMGIALYGMLSCREDSEKSDVGLLPVLSVKARVSLTKTLLMGEAVGYGLQFVAPWDMKIAVLTIGYADGYPRSLSCGVGCVLFNGMKAPVIGRVCMDQTIVDITEIENVRQNDVAVIIGNSAGAEITACELAEQAGTISNEILSRLGERLEKLVLH